MWEPKKNCYYCICRACRAIQCPHLRRFHFPNKFPPRCWNCTVYDKMHLFECDYFKPKGYKVYKVIRKHKYKDEILDRLAHLEELLHSIIDK